MAIGMALLFVLISNYIQEAILRVERRSSLSRRIRVDLTGECTYFEGRLNDCKERVISRLPWTCRRSRHRQFVISINS